MNNLEFDLALYSAEAVFQAAKAYAAIAQIEVEREPGLCRCSILRSAAPMELTALEFANYVLELSCRKEEGHAGT